MTRPTDPTHLTDPRWAPPARPLGDLAHEHGEEQATSRLGRVVLLAAVAGLAVALAAAGRGALAGPPGASPAVLGRWVQDLGPVPAAMALLRLAALGLCGQVLLASGIGWLGRILRSTTLLHLAQAVSVPGTRGVVRHLVGVSLSISSTVGPASHPPASPATAQPHASKAAVVLVRAEPGASGPVVLERTEAASTAVLHRTDHGPSRAVLRRIDALAPRPAPHPSAGREASPTWTTGPGDHLWSIAERHLAAEIGRSPSEAETDRYWRILLRANRVLADDDLLFVGQAVSLPAVPADLR